MEAPTPVRHNNFDFLRIAAATLVLLSHQFAYIGQPEPVLFYGENPGRIGVLMFFSISGYLVAQSWLRDPHPLRFAARRLLRIVPGVFVVTLLCALLLGPALTTLPLPAYFAAPEFFDYLRNLVPVWVRYHLPGVFESGLPHKMVNGPLWTIPIELRCYFALMLLGWLGSLRRPRLVLAGTLALSAAYFLRGTRESNHLWELGLFFLWGVCLHLYGRTWDQRPLAAFALAAGLSLAAYGSQRYLLGLLLLIPALVVIAGTRSTPVLNRFSRFGDLSFGIYIYSSPIQQTVYWLLGKEAPPWQGFALSIGLTLLFAWLSWHCVEKPALDLKQRLGSLSAAGALARLLGRRA